MKITIESTSRMVEVNGVLARTWEGKSEEGIPVFCAIALIATPSQADQSRFQRELTEHRAPSTTACEAIPLRMIL